MAFDRQQDQDTQGNNSRDSGHDSGQHSGQHSRPPSFLQVIQSTLAAAFGVQTEQARQRDFQHGRPLPFIIAGLIFTVVFVVLLVVVVNVVLRTAGG